MHEVLRNFIEITLQHGCSLVNLLYMFGIPFPKNTSEGLLLQNEEIAETFNDFFTKSVSNLDIPQYEDSSVNFEDPILLVIEQHKNHPSILTINAKVMGKQFSFQYFSKSEIKKEILNLGDSRACQESDITIKVIKANSDIFADFLCEVFNRYL